MVRILKGVRAGWWRGVWAGEVVGVGGEGSEVEAIGELCGEGGAGGEGAVGFEEILVDGGGDEWKGWRWGERERGMRVGNGGGGAGVGREVGGEGAGVEDGLDDGAVVGDEFEVALRKCFEIDGGGEFDGAGGEGTDEFFEEVGAGDEVFVFGGAFAVGAAGGVDVEGGEGGESAKCLWVIGNLLPRPIGIVGVRMI